MKTNSRIASSLLALICVFMLGSTGCMKDDMPDIIKGPDKYNAGTVDAKIPTQFEMVMIRHTGASVGDKSYSVSLMSDGKVIFEGQYNTAILGQRTLMVDQSTVDRVKNYFSENHFFELSEPAIVNDLAIVSIGYRPMMNQTVFVNTANDTPKYELYIFAREVEAMLGVNHLVNGADKREPMWNLKE